MCVDHFVNEFLEADAMAPAELLACLGWIAGELFHFGRPEIARVDFDQNTIGAGFDADFVDTLATPFVNSVGLWEVSPDFTVMARCALLSPTKM